MSQVERRILELDFDNDNFERSVKTSMDSLDDLQRKLEMRNGTDGLDKVERKANNISFRGLEQGISDASAKFTAFEISATDDINNVENRADKFSVRSLLSAIGDAALKFTGFKQSAQGDMSDVEHTVENFTMQSIASQLEELSSKFTTLGIVGMSVLNELTRTAMSFGSSMISKVIDPIVQGGKNRAFAIENAHFSLQGLIDDETEVQAIMQDALDSVDGTAYAYNDAASAAAQFAATGLRSGEEMQQTLRGIAGVAATTNAEYSEISHIFTTVAGNGRLMTEQLNQFSYRGMNAAASLTNAFNDVLNGSSDLSEEMQQHIKDLVSYGMSDIKDFSGSLEGITEGDLRALVSEGKIDFNTFSQIMAMTFGEHAKDANKTFNGSMSNIRSALARTGAMFYTDLIVQEGPLVKMFNSIRLAVNAFNQTLGPLAKIWTETVSALALGVSEVVDAFVDNDGMAGVGTLIEGLVDILRTFGEAFAEVFGMDNWNLKDTVGQAAKDFQEWAKAIKPTDEQLEILKRVASGVFAALKIGGRVVGTVISVFGRFLGALKPIGSVLVDIAANFGDWLVSVSDFLEQSGSLESIVDGLGGVFDFLGTAVGSAADSIWTFVKYVGGGIQDLGIFDGLAKRISDRFNDLQDSGGGFNSVLEKIKEKLSFLKPIFDGIVSTLKEFGGAIKDALTNAITTGDFSAVNAVINEGLFGALALSFTRFVQSLSQPGEELGNLFKKFAGIPKSVGEGFKALMDAIKGGSEGINPNNLIKLAVAIGLLAGSLLLMSQLDLSQMAVGLVGVAGVMAEFAVFMRILPKVADGMAKMKGLTKLATQLILLAIAIDIMASAVKKMGQLSYEEVVKGLVGIAGSMAILVAGARGLDKMTGTLKGIAGQMILLAIALNLLIIPVKAFSKLSMRELAKGLIGLAGSVGSLALLAKVLDGIKVKTSTSVSLILLATALSLMTVPVKKMSQLSLKELAKGLGSVGVMMGEMVGFVNLVKPEKIMKTSVSMIALGAALTIFAAATDKLGHMSVKELAKGLGSVGVLLAEMGLFANLVKPEKLASTSAAMLIMSGVMVILSDVMAKFGAMSVEELAKGLITIAASLTIFAVACFAMKNAMAGAMAISTIAGALVPLAFSLNLLAAIPIPGLVAGLASIAATFVIFGVAGAVLGPMLPVLLGLAGTLLALGVACLAAGVGIGAAALGISALAAAFTAGGAALVATVTMLFSALPFFFQQIGLAIVAFLQTIADSATTLIESLVKIGGALLTALAQLVPQAVDTIMLLITTLITKLAENIPVIVTAMLDFLVAMLNTIADHIGDIVAAGLRIITEFMRGIAEGLPDLIDQAFKMVIAFINGLADAIRGNHQALFDAVGNLITAIVEAIIDGITSVASAAGDLIGGFFEGIDDFDPVGAIVEVAENIVTGFTDAIGNLAGSAADAVGGFFGGIVDGAKDLLGIASPSKVFEDIGENTGQGWIDGLEGKQGDAEDSSDDFAQGIIDAFTAKDANAKTAGKDLSTSIVSGLQSNKADYGNTGTTQANSFVDNVRNKFQNAKQAGTTVTTNTVDGLKSNASEYGSNATTQANSFVDNVSNKFTAAKQAGTTVTNNTVDGLKSNAVEYGNTGTTQTNSFVTNVQNKWQAGKTAGTTVTNQTVTGLKSNASEYGTTGTSQANSFVDNVSNKWQAGKTAGTTVTRNTVDGLKSNSGEYSTTGSSQGNNYVGGISADNYHNAYNTGSSLGNKAKDGAGSVSLYQIGKDACQGFINGLGSLIDSVKNTAAGIASAAVDKMKSLLGIGSPSKLLRQYGRWVDEGLILGFKDLQDEVGDASGNVAMSAVQAMSDSLSNMPDGLDDMSFEPTVTPVVDMSNIVAAGRQLEDIFDQTSVLANLDSMAQSIARSFDGNDIPNGSNVEKAGTVINQTFNQVNNSPKSLTTLEIYRRTKGLMAQAKGEVSLTNA